MLTTSAHGRLLYISKTLNELNTWTDGLSTLDEVISHSSKFHLANNDLTFYFFNHDYQKDGVYWQGREVIGFESALPPGIELFDSYTGEMYEFSFDGLPLSLEELFKMAGDYAAQIPDQSLLANTWCIRLRGIDHGISNKNGLKSPYTVFQFFKKT